MKFFEKIKNKDPEKQDLFIFGVSFGVTFLIFAIWLLTVIYGFSAPSSSNSANSSGPIEMITDKFSDILKGTETYTAE